MPEGAAASSMTEDLDPRGLCLAFLARRDYFIYPNDPPGAGGLDGQTFRETMVAAGRPAKVLRERHTEGKSGDELDHIWLF